MIKNIEYFIYSIIGALILPLLYYCSKHGKYKIASLIPAIPIMGLLGLSFIIFHKGDINSYIVNHSKFLSFTVLLYLCLLMLYYFTKNIFLSILLALIIWSTFICYDFYK